jgi:hypothetical protein
MSQPRFVWQISGPCRRARRPFPITLQGGRAWIARLAGVATAAATLFIAAVAPVDALAASNLLQNPSLENASGNTPTCWRLAGYGTNTYRWLRTTDAHSGNYAENLDITSWSSGDRKLLSALDSGTCAPAATVGVQYTVTAWYKGAGPRFYAYFRNSSGSWRFWSESGNYPASSSWVQGSWTTPAFPSGGTLIAVGLGIDGGTGSLTMDDLSLTQAGGTTGPSVPTGLAATAGDRQVSLSWNASTDSVGVSGYDVYRGGTRIAQTSGTSYIDTGLTDGTTYTYTVAAYDAAGNTSAQSGPVSATPVAPSGHFGTVASGQGSLPAGYPRPDATCAAEVRSAPENRPGNVAANHTMPANNGANVNWNHETDFPLFTHELSYVTGHYTGTTDEILQWGACKWGLDEDLLRADAAQESWWHQGSIGDTCGGTGSTGIGSYGILQVKNKNCSGSQVLGGWPDTQTDTALAVDYTAMHFRACFDGAYQGYLYDGKSVSQDIAAHQSYADPVPLTGDHGQDYVLWGCVGQWYSGGWWDSGARGYVSAVQGYMRSKPWTQPGF